MLKRARLEKRTFSLLITFAPVKSRMTMQQKPSTREEYAKRIYSVIEFINNHLADDMDLEMLAGISHFSVYHFHRIFKAFAGEPLGAFITRMRVETAARLLRYSDMPIEEITYKVGYDVPSSLSKVFKQYYAITPTDYRNHKKYTIMKPFKMNPDLVLEEKVVVLEPKQAIYIGLTGDYKNNDYALAWHKLWSYLKSSGEFTREMEGIASSMPISQIIGKMLQECKIAHVAIYHDDPKITEAQKQRADICLVLPFQMEPKGEIGVKEIAGGKYASFLYTGPYSQLDEVYDTIFGKYIPNGGYQVDARPLFEIYLNDPACTQPEKLQTEIFVPVL